MYYHREMKGHRIPLDVSDQQRCHVTEAQQELVRQELSRKVRGKVRYVNN